MRFFLQQDNGDALLPFHYEGIYSTWVRERERLGLASDLDLHSFRHTFISHLVNRTGTPLTEAKAVAGHSSVKTTEMYVHRDESVLRVGMQRLSSEMVSSWYQDDHDGVET